jgi:flagellar biosynthesis/type III secretory pathway M-ring protein FliF/YscJ
VETNTYTYQTKILDKGDNMEKWKELSKRKKFLVAVGVLVVIAVVGWVSGWWASPEVV